MQSIQFECPNCHAINTSDESLYGERFECRQCHVTILVPPAPVDPQPPTARLIPRAAPVALEAAPAATEESDIFELTPVVRAYSGQVLLGALLVVLGIALAIEAPGYSWPEWVALLPLAPGLLLFLLIWSRVKSQSYRLTTQRLFVRRGWLAKRVNELELYRVKDVVVNQGMFERLLGYGTITVLADDDSTPAVNLVGVARPTAVKEVIRTQYRAARQREGVRPTEFLRSP